MGGNGCEWKIIKTIFADIWENGSVEFGQNRCERKTKTVLKKKMSVIYRNDGLRHMGREEWGVAYGENGCE